MNEDDYNELESSIFEVLDDCIHNHLEFNENDIIESFYNDLIESRLFEGESAGDSIFEDIDLREIIEECIYSYYEIFKPSPLEEKLNKLREIHQPEQRTEEWYQYRHGLITASTVWKIFKSQASLNSIIYEKCLPYSSKQIFSNSMQWGQMFEPISIMLYEKRVSTKVEEFGCIVHPEYPFLGASPDGINTDPTSLKFGVMIEVKNIVNRFITDKPKEEYWIQMQIQMEVCDLDKCDFIETRFKEYSDETEYKEGKHEEKGFILIGYNVNDYTPHYHYPTITNNDKEKWIQEKIEENQYLFHKIIYWYLDEFSCLSIERNREWFKNAILKIKETWDLICSEKINGYQHRKPKQRNSGKNIPHSDLFDEENAVKVIKL